MGHAIHFLERLERVNAQHVERALWMYQNGPVLRGVLHELPLPDSAERVAVSLEDDVRPFVIVTRTGAFVTCLAAGLRVHDTPVVSRQSFEHASAKERVLRSASRSGCRARAQARCAHGRRAPGSRFRTRKKPSA